MAGETYEKLSTLVRVHVVTGCDDCVAEHQGVCLLADPDEGNIVLMPKDHAYPDWCPLRTSKVMLRLEPSE